MQITLKAARVNAGMTMQDVAVMIGVTVKTISNWERGITPIPATSYHKLCRLYGADEDYVQIPVVNNNEYDFF